MTNDEKMQALRDKNAWNKWSEKDKELYAKLIDERTESLQRLKVAYLKALQQPKGA